MFYRGFKSKSQVSKALECTVPAGQDFFLQVPGVHLSLRDTLLRDIRLSSRA